GVVRRAMALENPNVNGHWVCNEGRENYGWVNRLDRLQYPLASGQQATWTELYVSLSERLKSHLDQGPDSLAVVANCSQTVEELYLLRRLFRDNLQVTNFAAIARPDEKLPQTFKRFKE